MYDQRSEQWILLHILHRYRITLLKYLDYFDAIAYLYYGPIHTVQR